MARSCRGAVCAGAAAVVCGVRPRRFSSPPAEGGGHGPSPASAPSSDASSLDLTFTRGAHELQLCRGRGRTGAAEIDQALGVLTHIRSSLCPRGKVGSCSIAAEARREVSISQIIVASSTRHLDVPASRLALRASSRRPSKRRCESHPCPKGFLGNRASALQHHNRLRSNPAYRAPECGAVSGRRVGAAITPQGSRRIEGAPATRGPTWSSIRRRKNAGPAYRPQVGFRPPRRPFMVEGKLIDPPVSYPKRGKHRPDAVATPDPRRHAGLIAAFQGFYRRRSSG